jgi:hypothetical protein
MAVGAPKLVEGSFRRADILFPLLDVLARWAPIDLAIMTRDVGVDRQRRSPPVDVPIWRISMPSGAPLLGPLSENADGADFITAIGT